MSNQNSREQAPIVGGRSLVVIFAVLCLTVFALLGLSTVRADKRLADINVKAVTDYYSAEFEAEEILAKLRGGEIPEGVTLAENNVYTYSVKVSETQMLCVEVAFEEKEWNILRWQTVSTTEWSESDGLAVWKG